MSKRTGPPPLKKKVPPLKKNKMITKSKPKPKKEKKVQLNPFEIIQEKLLRLQKQIDAMHDELEKSTPPFRIISKEDVVNSGKIGECHHERVATNPEQLPSEIHLRSPNGLHSICLKAADNGPGVWLMNGNNRNCISIYSINYDDGTFAQNGIGIYGDTRKSYGLNVCLSVDKDNNPFMQLVDKDGAVKILSMEDFQCGASCKKTETTIPTQEIVANVDPVKDPIPAGIP